MRIGLFAVLVVLGQASMAGTTVSFPAMLDGGSKGVPHLSGTISLSETRIKFEAFPQVENLTLSCGAIKAATLARGHKGAITIVSADATYRFDLHNGPQSQRFMETLTSNCKNLLKDGPSAQR